MKKLNVLYQFNEKYAPYAGVSITSLLINNKAIDEITVYALTERVTNESRKKLQMTAERYQREIVFIDTEELVVNMQKLGMPKYRNSYAANMKMFISMFLDKSVERLLYIDSDTIINSDLGELLAFNMQNNPIAMVLDSLGQRHKRRIGLNSEELYFNTGVILFDIKTWNEKKCTERIVNHVKNVRTHYMAPDQDLINIVMRGEIIKLDMSYNVQPIHLVYNPTLYYYFFGKKYYYTKSEIKTATTHPKILHFFRFLGEFPWHKDSMHPDVLIFDEYLKKSLWKDYQKKPTEKNGIIFRVERWIYCKFPQILFLLIFKLNYEYFLWKANRDSLNQKNNKNM